MKVRRVAVFLLILITFFVVLGAVLYRELYHYRRVEALRPKAGAPFTNGEVIIHAIEAFRDTNSRLPDGLEDLSPQYLGRIPSSGWGTGRWVYSRDGAGNGYILAAPRRHGDYVGHVYHSRAGAWVYEQ